MPRIIRCVILTAVFLTMAAAFCYADTIGISTLVDKYKNATTVQRSRLSAKYRYHKLYADAVVKDVEIWDTFDGKTDKARRYYKAVTRRKKTRSSTPYQILIFYKDKKQADLLKKRQRISLGGSLIKIVDERLVFSVWIYAGKLTAQDKAMLNK